MKWSEMERELRLASPAVYNLDGMLAVVKSRVEAAGVAWDPEEGPLPERLRCLRGTCSLWPSDQDRMTGPLALRLYAEAVRRWNAWPELERLAAEAAPHAGYLVEAFTARLREILESDKP